MNVTFHSVGAVATAALLSSTEAPAASSRSTPRHGLLIATIGFVAGIVEHGFMDYVPHSYPIPSGIDVIVAILLFVVVVIQAKSQFRVLVTACFLGSVFPDLVDLGPPILNHHFHWTLPTVKIFPWHWPQYSGSLYHGAKRFQSAVWHCIVIGVYASLCWFYRRSLFNSV